VLSRPNIDCPISSFPSPEAGTRYEDERPTLATLGVVCARYHPDGRCDLKSNDLEMVGGGVCR